MGVGCNEGLEQKPHQRLLAPDVWDALIMQGAGQARGIDVRFSLVGGLFGGPKKVTEARDRPNDGIKNSDKC